MDYANVAEFKSYLVSSKAEKWDPVVELQGNFCKEHGFGWLPKSGPTYRFLAQRTATYEDFLEWLTDVRLDTRKEVRKKKGEKYTVLVISLGHEDEYRRHSVSSFEGSEASWPHARKKIQPENQN